MERKINIHLPWTLCMLPGGPKLKEDHAGNNCSAPLCPSALRLWWEVAQWKTSSSTSSYDASLWRLPEPSHVCLWIQGLWRGMPRVLRQFCWSTRDSSGWDPAALEAAEYHLRGAGNGGTRINQVEVIELSLQSTFSSSYCPLSTQRMLWENLRLFVRLSFTCHCRWCCWSFNSHCFSFFMFPRTFPTFASFPCSPHLISFYIPCPLTSA